MSEQKSIEEIIAEMGPEDTPFEGTIVFMTPDQRERLRELDAQQQLQAL
jgi:hypothetical protein